MRAHSCFRQLNSCVGQPMLHLAQPTSMLAVRRPDVRSYQPSKHQTAATPATVNRPRHIVHVQAAGAPLPAATWSSAVKGRRPHNGKGVALPIMASSNFSGQQPSKRTCAGWEKLVASKGGLDGARAHMREIGSKGGKASWQKLVDTMGEDGARAHLQRQLRGDSSTGKKVLRHSNDQKQKWVAFIEECRAPGAAMTWVQVAVAVKGTAAMDGYIARVKTTLAFSDGLVEGTGTKHAPHAPREHRSWSEYSRTLQTYPDDVGTVRCRLNKGWQSCTPAQSTVPATNASVVFVPLDSPVFDASAIMACVHSSKP